MRSFLIATAMVSLMAAPAMAQNTMTTTTTTAKMAGQPKTTTTSTKKGPPPASARSEISKTCSASADSKGLHGKDRQKFRRQCMKGG